MNNQLFIGNIFSELNAAFRRVIIKSKSARLAIHREFAAFYNNDYEEISRYLREYTKNNPFSEKTLETLKFRHVNVVKKFVNRIASGVLTKNPVIKLSAKESPAANDKLLAKILQESAFFKKLREAFRKAVYFNIIEAHVVWDAQKNKIRIDIITPDNYDIDISSDYLVKSAIVIAKCDENGELYLSYWDENSHYNLKGEQKIPVQSNNDMVNPYIENAKQYGISPLPFSTLRMEEGIDYFGEPNWNIFLHQKNFDIRLTDLNEAELKTIHQIYLGINTEFGSDESFKAGQFKQINKVKESDVEPKITSIISNVDYTSIRENVDWHNRTVMNSEGIDSNSASTDKANPQSGASKYIDQIEVFETREEYKQVLYDFTIDLLNKIRMVWNTYNPNDKLNEKANFSSEFVESDILKTTAEKKAEYDMGVQYGYYDEVDIAMRELEISEQEALDRIKARAVRRKELNTAPEPMPQN